MSALVKADSTSLPLSLRIVNGGTPRIRPPLFGVEHLVVGRREHVGASAESRLDPIASPIRSVAHAITRTIDQPADVRARIIERDHRSASHLAVHMLDGATLAHGLSDSPAGLLAWLLERWNGMRRGLDLSMRP